MHDDQGHFGYSKTLQRAQKRYFWPQMSSQVDEWCRKCKVCQQRRNPVPTNRAPLQPITILRPGELVTMDIVERSGKNLLAKMIEEVCNFLEVWNRRTTPFHPQSDGASERSIRTVNNMLAKVVAEDQRNWDLYVSSSCFAYNTAVQMFAK